MRGKPDLANEHEPTYPCPTCARPMRLVGRETVDAAITVAELLTFQCECGQIIAANTQ